MSWSGGLISWEEHGTVHISVVFSWQKEKARKMAEDARRAVVGGPAVYNDPGYFDGIEIAPQIDDTIYRHNEDATFTTRGCVRNCPFCIVPRIEPEYIELKEWPVRPIVCDNNLFASSKAHFDDVVDKLKPLKGVDFNQGLDARLLTKHHAERLRELDMKSVRLAWDWIEMEEQWMAALELLLSVGFSARKIRTYVLIGYNDTPEDALYRLEKVKSLGVMPNPMRYQPLDVEKRNGYISDNWTDRQLKDYMRYWSKQIWLWNVPFEEYRHDYVSKRK